MPLSEEQQAIVGAPLSPLAVIACAGSGKTATAIQRVVAMRRAMGNMRGRVALLSFSNVAAEVFRTGYKAQSQTLGAGRERVDIDTLDGFFATHILRAHAYRTMGAERSAYLVTGHESFLDGFTCPTARFPISANDIRITVIDGEPFFYHDVFGNRVDLDQAAARRVVTRLGRIGAYTHELGRYWCYRVLREQPEICRAFAHRYPHIVVDEAQDIGSVHQAILEVLSAAGVQVSLIGDPNQGIYEFAGADGQFLQAYHRRPEISPFALTRNYRSVPPILQVANRISRRNDVAERGPELGPAVCFIGYTDEATPQLLEAFQAEVQRLAIPMERAAVVCRANALAKQLADIAEPAGRGLVQVFADAALARDVHGRLFDAFTLVARGVTGLLDDPPKHILARLIQPAHDAELHGVRRLLWQFTRDAATGLPLSLLPAAGQWHTLLLGRIRTLLAILEADHGLPAADRLGNRLTRALLPEAPLNAGRDLFGGRGLAARVDTVHQVKGESIDAVLYVATRQHIDAMLAGVNTELGRIGYVALTRARNLFWLGVPSQALRHLRAALLEAGFVEAGRGG